MSFHVVLPSNSSFELYPENKLSDFRVQLAKPIDLSQPYEVALEEIAYPLQNYHFESFSTWIEIHHAEVKFDQETGGVSSLTWTKPGKYQVRTPSIDGGAALLQELNEKFRGLGWECKFENTHFKLVNKEITTLVALTFHPKLAYALGLVPEHLEYCTAENGTRTSRLPAPILFQNRQMFVYANVVGHQIVGHTLAPLLRI